MAGLNYNKNSTTTYDIDENLVTNVPNGIRLLGVNIGNNELEAFVSLSKIKDYINTDTKGWVTNNFVDNTDLDTKVSEAGYAKSSYVDNNTHWKVASGGGIEPKSASEVHASSFYADSDKTLKTNIHKVTDESIKNIDKLDIVEFDWKSNNAHSVGMIAQDVEKLFPYLVRDGETKTVNYIPLLLLKIASLEKRIQELEDKNGNK